MSTAVFRLTLALQIPCFLFCFLIFQSPSAPASLSSLLHFNRDYHDYLTRSYLNLHRISRRYQFAISSQAPTIWNDMPLTIYTQQSHRQQLCKET